MLYTAEHLSLACLEVLVHLDKGQLPRDYVWSKTELSAIPGVLRVVSLASIGACQSDGDSWIRDGSQLAIRVATILIPEEFNVLLNPNHADYKALVWSEPRRFNFDPRLFVAEPHTL